MQASVIDEETMAELLFSEIDEDGSGTLERDEIDALAKQLGRPLSSDELDAAMAEMDADGGGDVDFPEFLEWYKRSQQVRPHPNLALGPRLPPVPWSRLS